MSKCYKYEEIATSDNPIFKNVDVTLILAMTDSNRFNNDSFILNLTKKTIIQYNDGFRKCVKPDTITKSNHDINHAYYTAFNYLSEYDNVIILEDDAVVLNYNKYHYNIIDNYIQNNKFYIISLGSLGVFNKINDDFYKITEGAAGAQAQIISKETRTLIYKQIASKKFIGHVDFDYFSKYGVIIYKEPLIVQVFTDTENFGNWDHAPTWVHRAGTILNGSGVSKEGWHRAYILCKFGGEIRNYKSIILLLLFVIVFIFYKKQ